MYTLIIVRFKERCLSMKSEILSLKTIKNDLDFLRKAIIIPSNV